MCTPTSNTNLSTEIFRLNGEDDKLGQLNAKLDFCLNHIDDNVHNPINTIFFIG